MRAILKPIDLQFQITSVYSRVTAGIDDNSIQAAFNGLAAQIAGAAAEYDSKAESEELYTIPADSRPKETVYLSGLTKKQFSNLYSYYMVQKDDPRQIYDNLLELAPNGKCPFCGYCDATTLDHYLPKAKFPLFTVLPINLVPSCPYCNTGKNADVATNKGEQTFHPYYDHYPLEEEQWVFAEVVESAPASITFYVDPPAGWDSPLPHRAAAHFTNNELGARFAVQAADELSSLRNALQFHFDAGGSEGVQFHLCAQATSEYLLYKNSWKTAMYQALANSTWFCEGGFALG